ncbi:hypothetical protein A5667_09180 [Mycolicibacterium fortuitum]|nr:hypothetical protein A5667_09180 [Mycolicibacterium fortuitum]
MHDQRPDRALIDRATDVGEQRDRPRRLDAISGRDRRGDKGSHCQLPTHKGIDPGAADKIVVMFD